MNWEYNFFIKDEFWGWSNYKMQFEEFGKNGWELVTIQGRVAMFKRPERDYVADKKEENKDVGAPD